MNWENIKNIYFVGLGGIGISALANILLEKGYNISGSEIVPSEITERLESKQVKINTDQNNSNITKEIDLLIYTAAVDISHPELQAAKELSIPIMSYPQALGEFSKNYKLLAISGTHGKSTVTAMLSKILIETNFDPNVVIGTKTQELNGTNFRVGSSEYLIIEACEYKDSFLNFHPDILVINNLEPDHLDHFKTAENYYKTFQDITQNIKPNGTLIAPEDVIQKIKPKNDTKVVSWKEPKLFELKIPGKFNQENAQNAFLASQALNVDPDKAKQSLGHYNGSWRRLEYKQTKFKNTIFIDDYAHHPTEIKATLQALRNKYPNKKLLTVFQPHQFNRTKHFLKGFAESFANTNQVIIPDIYQVRDTAKDIQEVSAKILVDKINHNSKNALHIEGLKKTAEYIKENHTKYDIIITMGAGNITDIYEYFI